LHETDPSLPCPRLGVDDCESSLPLESNVVDDAPLTNLMEAFDHHLTSLSFVVPFFSTIPTDTSISDSILLASPLPLAQYRGVRDGRDFSG